MAISRSLTALALAAATLAAPVIARDASPSYRAELAAPSGAERIVAGGMLWLCDGTSCVAGKDNSRPLIVCKRLAKETEAIARFTVAGEDLAAEDLERCNA
jgi:hypothetical protein